MYRSARLPALALCLIIPVAVGANADPGADPGADVGVHPGVHPGAETRADGAVAGTARPGAPALPGRGMTMQTVERGFGHPAEVIDPIGEPPITRWIYEGYTVYFDHHHVIHTVRTDAPANARGVGPAGRGDPHVAAR